MKKKATTTSLEQWIEVTIQEGCAVTTPYPSNADLRKIGQAMQPPPEMVYRRINFPTCVPPPYWWTTNDQSRRQRGGHCLQRMSLETWLHVSAQEEAAGAEHIGRCGAPLPRPLSRGGCECPTCVSLASQLESRP
jgi:hypothetical protein